jgi:hypothetical protein
MYKKLFLVFVASITFFNTAVSALAASPALNPEYNFQFNISNDKEVLHFDSSDEDANSSSFWTTNLDNVDDDLSSIPPQTSTFLKSSFWKEVDVFDFQASENDTFLVDVPHGMGYLVNEKDRIYTSFRVLTGQRRVVRYIGRRYFAGTPEQTWYARSREIKRDRVTFSSSGEFFRLYFKNAGTPYGIHGYKYYQQNIAKGALYLSMGCILVDDRVLDVIEKSFYATGKNLKVVTTSDESVLPFSL